MNKEDQRERDPLQHPLVRKLNGLLASLADVAVIVVRPRDDGWQQVAPGGRGGKSPEFCKMIQSTQDGVNMCKMCHVLMSAAACSGSRELTCHAGAHVILGARQTDGQQDFAVLTSCMFADVGTWSQAEARALKLGINPLHLKKAFMALPRLTEDQLRIARLLVDAIVDAVEEVIAHAETRDLLRRAPQDNTPSARLNRHLRWRLSSTSPKNRVSPDTGLPSHGKPPLIKVLEGLINDRPDLPLTINALASAACVTPNHLSMVFKKHTGKRFVDYLADRRIELAKQLLDDLSLNIADVAARTGFADAGYFTRRFRQKMHISPKQWRHR